MREWICALAVLGVTACGGSHSGASGSSNEPVEKDPAPAPSASPSTGVDAGAPSPAPGVDAGSPQVDSGTAAPSADASVTADGGTPPDGGYGDVTIPTSCGMPGDVGNSLGVGMYCTSVAQCLGNTQATLCATLGNPNMQFCTFLCTQGSPTACGTGASCECQSGECGCVPDSCL
jgi:hypothetical protein